VAYWVLKAILGPLLRLFFDVRAEGTGHVPPRGPVILASNHISFADSIFLPLVLRRRVTFVAKAEYFERRRTAWFFRATGQIPIDRSGGAASAAALDAARRVLAAGGAFGIYPEGTRSPDGCLYRGHTGVARLALELDVPVVAVGMVGTAQALPIGSLVPRPFVGVRVRFSAPVPLDRHADPSDPRVLRQATDAIMFEIAALSGQTYVDRYVVRERASRSGERDARAGGMTTGGTTTGGTTTGGMTTGGLGAGR
jgi:1-acyl-sn-glycerol-3-phosphate acyltransferase